MRMRRKRNLDERLAACQNIIPIKITDLNMQRSVLTKEYFDYAALFGNANPVQLEIGCGKGQFVLEMAKRHPDRNFIALERISNVMVEGAEHAQAEGVSNVKFLCCRAECVEKYFPPHSIERIYLNFSNPLPKDGYAKQRLTHAKFLAMYRTILVQGGGIWQKTDNRAFFDFSLEQYRQCGFLLKNISYDLEKDGFAGNVVTEHEQKFMDQGLQIHRVEAYAEGQDD